MSKNEPLAISIKGVSKLFRLQKQRTFKELLPALAGGQKAVETFWALQDINLDIKKGETVGIIGPNGAGKSTLLKLMAGVTKPTKGEIKINGDIAPLIELGAGFHPELTGRENITLNGVILGMSKEQVAEKFKEIVDFAELWEFIDQPIKHYSSGMYLRLAFSVAVHTKPDILLIDEILAVGDESFKQKCFKKMEEFKKQGVTIVLVSHALEQIKEFCTRAVYLDEHRIIMDNGVEEVCKRYLQKRF
jgi:ABC-2 type transport system ATP-binding protein